MRLQAQSHFCYVVVGYNQAEIYEYYGGDAFWNNNWSKLLATEESTVIDDGSTLWDDGNAVLYRELCHDSKNSLFLHFLCKKLVFSYILFIILYDPGTK